MRKIILGCFLLLAAEHVQAQKGVNSLYSAFGIGDLEEKDYSRSFGMGSAGIARPSGSFLNELNPASYGRIPMETFLFEVSLAAKALQYNTSTESQPAGDVNFKRVAMGFKPHKLWGVGIGLMPYSRVDYKLLNTKYIEGTNTGIRNAVEGSGGINRLYLSNALQISKNFSIGVSTAFLFGPVTTTDSLGSSGSDEDIYSEQRRAYRSFNLTTGLQYNGKIGKWQLGLGATYRFKSTLSTEDDFSIHSKDATVLYEEERSSSNYVLPEQIGAGLSLTSEHITWVADYRQQNWKGMNPNLQDYKYVNSRRYAAGVEYSLYKYYFDSRVEGLSLQAGFNYHTGYMQIKGQQINDLGFSLGGSLPSKTGHLRYYLGVEVGQRGTALQNLVKENYINFVLHLSMRDNWFFKRREY